MKPIYPAVLFHDREEENLYEKLRYGNPDRLLAFIRAYRGMATDDDENAVAARER